MKIGFFAVVRGTITISTAVRLIATGTILPIVTTMWASVSRVLFVPESKIVIFWSVR